MKQSSYQKMKHVQLKKSFIGKHLNILKHIFNHILLGWSVSLLLKNFQIL
jgi:hypothetical protein